MAAETNTTVEFSWEADVYTLKSTGGKVQLLIEGQVAHPDVSSAKITEDGSLSILGRTLGTLDVESMGDISGVAEKLRGWFPDFGPGAVKHGHSLSEFDDLKSSGIAVGKFSAEWCGPCKQVAPFIEKLSVEYPDVTFIHMDESEAKALFRREGVGCYPTFRFYKDGVATGEKVEGGNWKKVEEAIVGMGAQKTELAAVDRPENDEIIFICERDQFKVVKSEQGVALFVGGRLVAPPGKCPYIEIDNEAKSFTIGRNTGKVYLGDGVDFETLANQVKALFPTEVKHIDSTAQYAEIVGSGMTVAKFSAEWCGPCKAIAATYHEMSSDLEGKVNFLHIDVDKQKELAQSEQIKAMPTFHFYKDGVKQQNLMVKGANIRSVVENLGKMGIDTKILQKYLDQ